MQMDTTDRAALTALRDASRAFTDALDAVLNHQGGAESPTQTVADPAPSAHRAERDGLQVWDPLVDAPLVGPKVKGTRQEQDWCSLVYLGAVWAINVRAGRGATTDEVRDFAVKAGYRDGRAVTAWSKGNGATRNDDRAGRWMTAAGKQAVLDYAVQCRVRLPADLVADLADETS